MLLFSCKDLPTNPDNATNSAVSLSLKSTVGLISEQQVSDTAGNTVEIVIALRYPEYIKSTKVQVLASNDSIEYDTSLISMSKKYQDTIRLVKTFSVPGIKRVVATAYIQDNSPKYDTALMTIINPVFIQQEIVNHKPELLVNGNEVITVDQTCTLSVVANDSDLQQVHTVYVWNKGKSNVVANKKYAWTPALGFIGKDTLMFIVTDNGSPILSDTVNFVVEVNAPNPAVVQPSISIDTTGTNVGKGDTVSTNSATITVIGNRTESRFRARIDSSVWSQWQLSGTFTFDSLTSGSHAVMIESKYEGVDDVVTEAIAFFVRSPKSTAKALASFDFASLNAKGAITESARTVAVTVPYETNVSALVATFVTTGVSVKVGSKVQASDTTPNDFTKPVIYRVTAADNSYLDYTVIVEVASNTSKAITAFSFSNSTSTVIDTLAKTIVVNVPFSTEVTALVPILSHSGTSVSPASGAAQNFTKSVTYTVTAADGTTQSYVVTVTESANSAKAITAFSFVNPNVAATINETAKTIAVHLPYGTNRSGLVASLTTTGVAVKIGATTQVSGTTQNDFSSPVPYTVIAADGTTQSYVVAVTELANSAKAITAFSFANPNVAATINEAAKTIAVTVPYGTNRSGLVASFTITGAAVRIGSTVQVSSTTQNDFTGPVTYMVIAEDNSTQAYMVTVSYAPYIFTVTFDGQSATVGPTPSTRTVTAPATNVDALPTDPQRDNFRFDGWFTGINGGGTAFVGSTNVTQSMDVYAKWTPVYIVTYNGNGSTVPVPVDVNKYQNGQTVSVLSGITRTDYTFAGWNTQADTLGANYLSGNTFAMGSVNLILYAKWRMNKPTFTAQPVSQSCPVNDSVTFTVSASGANLEYQWQKNSVDITNAITASYTPPALTIADSLPAVYKCVVSNAGGNVLSSEATLAISTVSDASGNEYHQVKIGNQIWTMENLRTTKYNDNTDIPKDTTAATWINATTPKYCYYDNTSNMDSIKKFGALYNWYTISPTDVKKIAPTGWHVPTDAEWTTLSTFLGGVAEAGGKMKEAGTVHWLSPNTGATNSSGFSAFGGGCRFSNGGFDYQSNEGGWWSATENGVSLAWNRYLFYSSSYLRRDDFIKSCGYSVRLVRD